MPFNNKNDPNHPQQSLNANVVQVGVTKRHWALPGDELADRLMDHQDKIDRAELIERELKLAKARMGKEMQNEQDEIRGHEH